MVQVSRTFRHLCLLTALIGGIVASTVTSHAQSIDRRISSAEKQIRQLQKAFIQLRSQGGNSVATLDANLQSSAPMADLEMRLQQLETQLRQMTGNIERVMHQNNQLNERLDNLVKDYEFRLQDLEKARQPISPSAPATVEPNMTGDNTAMQHSPNSVSTTNPAAQTSQTANNNSVSMSEPIAEPLTEPRLTSPEPLLPEGSETDQYNFARDLVFKGDYGRAELALKEFLTQRAGGSLAGNAQYWLGQIYFAEKKYLDATKTFLDGYNKYPDSSKAPAFLLKIGMSLNAIGEMEEACNSFAELQRKFPKSTESLKRRPIEEKKAQCNN